MSLNLGPGTSDIYSNKGPREKLYTLNWQGVAVATDKKGPSEGQMKGVKAQVFTGANRGSTIESETGHASKDQNELDLHGNVTVTSQDKKSTLTCDSLSYYASRHRYYASGNVRYKSGVGSVGPFSKLIATADLNKVATPGEFDWPKEPTNRSNPLITFKSSDGKTTVEYRGLQIVQKTPETSNYVFTGGITGHFLDTGVMIVCDHAIASVKTVKSVSTVHTISGFGDVHILKNAGSNGGSDELRCDKVDFVNGKSESTATCPGKVILTHTNASGHQTMVGTGGRGFAQFAGGLESKKSEIRSATLFRPVKIRIDQPGAKGGHPDTENVSCSRLDYQNLGPSGVLTLSGGIRAVSKQGTIANLDSATIRLNSRFEAVGFQGSSTR